jgi:signal peptidase I
MCCIFCVAAPEVAPHVGFANFVERCCSAVLNVPSLHSGSMEPAFQRGDILFLWLGNAAFRVGEIVVFKIEGRDIPIVHRVTKVHEK